MVRDELMQRVVAREKEPITPFLERASELYEQAGISTILVVGSCGSYFYIADKIIQMDSYQAVDITDETKKILKNYPAPGGERTGFPSAGWKEGNRSVWFHAEKKDLPWRGLCERAVENQEDGENGLFYWKGKSRSPLRGAACG